jgi:hypothetical protein
MANDVQGEAVKMIPAILEKIEAEYQRSWWAWEKLERATFDEDYEEDFEDTITRKYEEGYSDALAMVQRLLEGASK